MKRILSMLGSPAVAAGVIVVAAMATPAQAAVLQVSGSAPYLCAAVYNNDTYNGSVVYAHSCSESPNQQWTFISGQITGIGSANLIPRCLDAGSSNPAPGTVVVMNQCNGSLSQQWLVDGYVVSAPQSQCLDSAGPSFEGGTELIINNCNGSASQNWIVRGLALQANTGALSMCANVKGNNTASGTPVVDYYCILTFNELWDYQNGLLYGLGTDGTTTNCLTGGSVAGSLVTLQTCTPNNPNQMWWFDGNDSEANPPYPWTLVRGWYSGLCLNSSSGSPNTQLIVSNCTPTASQSWAVE